MRQILIDASEAYYRGNPTMSDEEFDKIKDEYMLSQSSPELGIGYKPNADRSRKLPIPMFSLNKENSAEGFKRWAKSKLGHGWGKVSLVMTPKYDGISICVDELKSPERRIATTRGDGSIGQICDVQYSFMNNSDLEEGLMGITFGEAIMSKKAFSKYDSLNGGLYKNARNLVGSQINADRPTQSILKDIDYIRYGYVPLYTKERGNIVFENKSDVISHLNSLYSIQVPTLVVNAGDVTHDMIVSKYHEWNGDYEIDGIVIEVNNMSLAESIGRASSGNPSYAIAYKGHFENEELTSVVGVSWQVSKHGKLKPVINFETVRLSGADVSDASGYNARNIIDRGIGEGAIISVKRSGAVIPKVTHVHSPISQSEMLFPKKCPSCQSDVVWDASGVDLVCSSVNNKNSACSGVEISKMTSFFSVLKCKEVGRGTMESFYINGIKTVRDALAVRPEKMLSWNKYGIKKATKICDEIRSCVNGVTIHDLMHASCCFEGIGSDTIKLAIDGVLKDGADLREYERGVNDFKIFYEGVKDFIKVSGVDTAKTNKLASINAVFTGFRDEGVEKCILENGGTVSNSVTSKTSHLVVSFRGSGTSKEKKALDLNKPIMDRNEFIKYLESIISL